jgi:hypothetical protein
VIVGEILHVWATLARPPKRKIVMFVGTEQSLFLWFNTDARRNRPAQVPVAAHEIPGITHDCFLDCGWVSTFPERDLAGASSSGCAWPDFLLRVAEEIEAHATTLTAYHRRTIVAALRQAVAER